LPLPENIRQSSAKRELSGIRIETGSRLKTSDFPGIVFPGSFLFLLKCAVKAELFGEK